MEGILFTILVYHLIIGGIGFAIGYAIARRRTGRHHVENLSSPRERTRDVMLGEIERHDVLAIIGTEAQQKLREHYWPKQLPAASKQVTSSGTPSTAPKPAPSEPLAPPLLASSRAAVEPAAGTKPISHTALEPEPATISSGEQGPKSRPRPEVKSRKPMQLDPALVLLYLGAFLIVAAGLIYASFNWEQLAGGQKLVLLAAATVAFVVAGVVLLANTRLRPAAETFIGIGALLIPSNIIAAVTILSDTPLRATLALQIGSVFATLLYTFFSYRPGSIIYRYAAVISATIAIGVLPASLGAHRGWTLPIIALAPSLLLAAISRIGAPARRFWTPTLNAAHIIPVVAFVALPIVGMPPTQDTLVIACVLGGAAITLGTVAALRNQFLLGAGALVIALGGVALAVSWFELEVVRMALTVGFGVAMLVLVTYGPRFYRESLATLVTVASILGFGLTLATPNIDSDDNATWSVAIAIGLVALGWSLIAIVRHWWWLLTPSLILGFGAHVVILELFELLDGEDWTISLRLLPGLIAASALPAFIRTHGTSLHRRNQSFFLWIGFGLITGPLGALALDSAGQDEPASRIVAVGLLLLFVLAAIVAAQQHHRVLSLIIAAGWLIGSVVTALDPVPVTDEYRWPMLASAIGAIGLLLPLIEDRTWWRRTRTLRWPTIVFAVAAIVAASPMLVLAIALIIGERTLDESPWWLGYTMILSGIALVTGLSARYRHPNIFTALSAMSVILAVGLALRAGVDTFNPDPLIWPAIGIALALVAALGALRLDNLESTIARRWSGWVTIFAGLILLPSLLRAVPDGVEFIVSGWTDVTVRHGDEARWWLPNLLAFIAMTLTGHVIGKHRDSPFFSVVTAVTGLFAIALAARMITTDVFTWTIIGLLIGVAGAVTTKVLAQRSDESRYLTTWAELARLLQLVAVIALVVNIQGGIEGTIDPWQNVALYSVLTVTAAVVSIRLRRPELLYASTSSLGLAVIFVLLSPQVDVLDGMLIPLAISWILIVGSLTPQLTPRWAQPLEYSGYAFGTVPIIYAARRSELMWDSEGAIYQRGTLAILSLGLAIGLTALVRRSPVRGTVAVALATAAALRQVATYEPESWQPFAIVLAIALGTIGALWHRWPDRSNPLYGLAGVVLIGVPFLESFTIGGTTDAFIAGGYAVLVVVLGLIVRRQAPIAVGVIGVTLVVMRQLVDTTMAFESWQILAGAGAILIIGGTLILAIRDTLRTWLDSGKEFWTGLR